MFQVTVPGTYWFCSSLVPSRCSLYPLLLYKAHYWSLRPVPGCSSWYLLIPPKACTWTMILLSPGSIPGLLLYAPPLCHSWFGTWLAPGRCSWYHLVLPLACLWTLYLLLAYSCDVTTLVCCLYTHVLSVITAASDCQQVTILGTATYESHCSKAHSSLQGLRVKASGPLRFHTPV